MAALAMKKYWLGGNEGHENDFNIAANWQCQKIAITAFNDNGGAADTLEIAGDYSNHFQNGDDITIENSASNDGTYDITVNSSYADGTTTITVDTGDWTDEVVGNGVVYEAAEVPIATDIIIFDGKAGDDTNHKYSCTDNLPDGVSFGAIYVQETFDGNVGSSSTDMFDCGATTGIYIRGSGTYYFAADTVDIAQVIVDNISANVYLATAYGKTNKITSLINVAGTVVIYAAAGTATAAPVVDEIINIGRSAKTTLYAGGTSATLDIFQVDGSVLCDSKFATWTVANGLASFGTPDVNISYIVGSKVTMYGGQFDWVVASTITTIEIYAGDMYAVGDTDKTLTGTSSFMYGGIIDLTTRQYGKVTVDTQPTLYGNSARYLMPSDDI